MPECSPGRGRQSSGDQQTRLDCPTETQQLKTDINIYLDKYITRAVNIGIMDELSASLSRHESSHLGFAFIVFTIYI